MVFEKLYRNTLIHADKKSYPVYMYSINTYAICDHPLLISARRSIASLQKSALMCEQMLFSCWRKSYYLNFNCPARSAVFHGRNDLELVERGTYCGLNFNPGVLKWLNDSSVIMFSSILSNRVTPARA